MVRCWLDTTLLCMVSIWELGCLVNLYLVIRGIRMLILSCLSLGGMHLAMRNVVHCALASVGGLLGMQTVIVASWGVEWDNFS